MAYFLQKMVERQNGVDDLCLMNGSVDDDSITMQLATRMSQGKIYTVIANVLIAANPYQILPIYGDSHVTMFKAAKLSDSRPHIFGLAERAYRSMLNKKHPQACIISGESGAGKTESAKLILHYISSVSGSSSGSAQKMKKVIFDANPLLESLGNAKTSRNNNSSRFGKYLNLQFNAQGEPVGGFTSNFLLEKSRVTYVQKGERSFHIFYQMLAGAWPELLKSCQLGSPSDYRYLAQSGAYSVDGVDDREMFHEVAAAMVTVGISPEEQWYIFSTFAAILHLGNVGLEGQDAPAKLARGSEYSLDMASYLLGVDKTELFGSINHKTVTMGGRRGSVVRVPQNADQSAQIRDALAKELYSRIFDLVVAKLNYVMDPRVYNQTPQHGCTVGLLDIYGFEIFENNSFEQFCINFVNEKLQQIFIDLTLRSEQQLYHTENIQVKVVPFFDNIVVCDLLEGPNPPGIFRLLDDTCRAVHAVDSETADTKFLEKLGGLSSKYFQMIRSTFNFRGGFTVTHYAGKVTYGIDGFCEKNKDTLFSSVIQAMQKSQNAFVRSLWANDVISSQAPTTSGQKIRTSAQQLVDELRKCETHYIRCIKSNDQKRPMYMDIDRVKHQVKYLGLKGNVLVYKAGYSYRAPYFEFIQTFEILLPQKRANGSGVDGARQVTDYLTRNYGTDIPSSEFGFGGSMLFISSPTTIFFMQELREQAIDVCYSLLFFTYMHHKYLTKHLAKGIR
jgi:myosin-1